MLNGVRFRNQCRKCSSFRNGEHPYFSRVKEVCIDLYIQAFRGCIETGAKIEIKDLTMVDELPQIWDIFTGKTLQAY